jgi:hypothetical protein
MKISPNLTTPTYESAIFDEAPGDHSASPTIALGDGNTGFYESADNKLEVSIAGTVRGHIDSNGISGGTGGTGAGLLNRNVASATEPGHNFIGDLTTGMGRAGANQLSLICNATEMVRIETTAAAAATAN